LNDPFLEKASEPSYIVDYVLKDLPPLGDRYAALHSADSVVDNLLQSLSETSEVRAPMSMPEALPVKKGGFAMRRKPTSPIRISSSVAVDGEPPRVGEL
jgi:hypothetical protein